MSLAFHVAATELPAFNAIIAVADIGEPVQLAGAGWVGDAWPKGLFAKIVDAASAPAKMELTPEMEASFARAGMSGSFLAYVRGSARGVVVVRSRDGANKTESVSLHVPVLASAADYRLAAKMAAAAATIAKTTVTIDDPGSAPEASGSVAPEDVLAKWTVEAADVHARQMGTWLADDIAQGRTYFFQGPRGFVALGPDDLAAASAEASPTNERFDLARAILVGDDGDPATRDAIDRRRTAVLLTAAMVFAAGADGVLAAEEARQLEAQFATVRELEGFPPRELLDAVRAEVSGIDALAELGSNRLRRKAFVLASEVIGSARDGKLGGDPNDPNVQAVSTLAKALGLDGDQHFLAQVVRTVMAKYEDSNADDTIARTLALGMMLTAAADGTVDERESTLLSALARTVPELRARDVGELFEGAKARLRAGLDAAFDDLSALDRSSNKCFALATEVALIAGRGPEGTALPQLLARVRPDRDYADAAIATFAAKYS